MSEPIRKILVPTDGSPASEAVVPAILPLLRAYKPDVLLLYVSEDPEEEILPPERVRAMASVLWEAGLQVHLRMRTGEPVREILRLARREKVDLIAMATQGRRGIPRLIAGSVAEDVLRHSDIPLLLTRPGIPARDWTSLLVALDGSPRAEEVLPDAVRLARTLGASVQVVRTVQPIIAGVMAEAPLVLPPEDPKPYLDQVVARLNAEGVKATSAAFEGSPAEEILRQAEATGASLLCLTTHGRSGLSRLLLGSVAEEMLRKSPCPVYLRRTVTADTAPDFMAVGTIPAF